MCGFAQSRLAAAVVVKGVVAFALCSAWVAAGTITGPFSGLGGMISGAVATPNPNGKNTPGNPLNTVDFTEALTGQGLVSQTGIAFFGLEYSPGSTGYLFTLNVTNSTAAVWTSFVIGVGNDTFGATIDGDPYNDALTLDYAAGFPASNAGGTLTLLTNAAFQWTDLNLAPGGTAVFTFSANTCISCHGSWLVDQVANQVAAPEPAMMPLCVLGLAAAGLRSRRNRRQRLAGQFVPHQ